MKIAQVAPLWESVPPKLYGGTERVVSFLTEELVKQGHEVTLFASGDSKTAARLIAPCAKALRLHEKSIADPMVYYTILLEKIFQYSEEFDLIHFHLEHHHYPLFRRVKTPFLTTLHSNLGTPDLIPLYHEYAEMSVVGISNSQRKPLPWLNWIGTVYHGLPQNLLAASDRAGQYLAFLGRISPEKGLDKALEIAKRAGIKIRIAAKVGLSDRSYFEESIRPLLDDPLVEFIGEISDAEKGEFLGNALALLFPIDWAEPFGMVMIEAMACGTPVIAFNRGSVPEVLQHGVTGFICKNVDEAIDAVGAVKNLNRTKIREVFESRFSAKRMADDYVSIYRRILNNENALFSIHRLQQSVMQ